MRPRRRITPTVDRLEAKTLLNAAGLTADVVQNPHVGPHPDRQTHHHAGRRRDDYLGTFSGVWMAFSPYKDDREASWDQYLQTASGNFKPLGQCVGNGRLTLPNFHTNGHVTGDFDVADDNQDLLISLEGEHKSGDKLPPETLKFRVDGTDEHGEATLTENDDSGGYAGSYTISFVKK
jgi:hypothetical protein